MVSGLIAMLCLLQATVPSGWKQFSYPENQSYSPVSAGSDRSLYTLRNNIVYQSATQGDSWTVAYKLPDSLKGKYRTVCPCVNGNIMLWDSPDRGWRSMLVVRNGVPAYYAREHASNMDDFRLVQYNDTTIVRIIPHWEFPPEYGKFALSYDGGITWPEQNAYQTRGRASFIGNRWKTWFFDGVELFTPMEFFEPRFKPELYRVVKDSVKAVRFPDELYNQVAQLFKMNKRLYGVGATTGGWLSGDGAVVISSADTGRTWAIDDTLTRIFSSRFPGFNYFGYVGFQNGLAAYEWPRAITFLSDSTWHDIFIRPDSTIQSSFSLGDSLFFVLTKTHGYRTDRISVSNRHEAVAPTEFLHMDAYPNPFNPATVVQISGLRSGAAMVEVFDLAGRVLLSRSIRADNSAVLRVPLRLSAQASGVYLVRVTQHDRQAVRKVMLLK